MDLFLVRHAKAEQGVDDFNRQLTSRGKRDAASVADLLERRGVSVERIEHSPLVRARQTAEILAESLRAPLLEVAGLAPDASVDATRDRLLMDPTSALILVGHNPFMEMLAALLVADESQLTALTFHTASVARLIAQPHGSSWRFTCDWLVTPSLMGQ